MEQADDSTELYYMNYFGEKLYFNSFIVIGVNLFFQYSVFIDRWSGF